MAIPDQGCMMNDNQNYRSGNFDCRSSIKEIIKSFIAACASKRFTPKLTIVIRPHDYYQHDINVLEIDDFLKSQCKYTEFKDVAESGGGTPVEEAVITR